MPAAWAGAASAVIGTATSLANSSQQIGSESASGMAPTGYQPINQPGADQNYTDIMNSWQANATNLPGQITQDYQNYYNNIVNNPYSMGALTAGNRVADYGSHTLTPQLYGASAGLFNSGMNALPYGNQILQTGFDPQNALYNRTQQQLTDQNYAALANSGLAGTPYGAGLTMGANNNFNIDWQNQQLQRQAAAAQGYGALTGAAGQNFGRGAALGNQGMTTDLYSGGLVGNLYNQQQMQNMAALGQYSQGAAQAYGGIAGPQLGAAANYLKLGQNSTQLAQQGIGQNNAYLNQQGQQLGQSLGSLGNVNWDSLFGSSSSGANAPSVVNAQNQAASMPGWSDMNYGGASAGGGYYG